MSAHTFGDQHRAAAVCLAATTLLLSNPSVAQQPPGPSTQPAVAFPDAAPQPAPQQYPTNPQAPPPPPPPPPYASPAPSAPPPAYGPAPTYPQPQNGNYPPGPPPNVAPTPAPQPYPGAPPPPYGQPGTAQPQPYSPQQPYPAQQSYPPPQQPYGTAQPSYASGAVEAPAYPPAEPQRELKIPDFSVRIDPLNWVVEGQLGLELEVEAFEWLTVETVPIFVMAHEPLALPDGVRQYSNGLGPLAGASLSAGFWLEGDSFRGTVVRAGLTRYGYHYASIGKKDEEKEGERLDEVSLTQTRLTLMLGSGRRFGYFTLGGGFGIEYELFDRQRQCVRESAGTWITTKDGCDSREFLLRRRASEPDAANIRGFLFPLEFTFRFSLGVVFDD